MNLGFGLAIVLLVVMSAWCTRALPMANEAELAELASAEQADQTQELPHILKIAPKHEGGDAEPQADVYDTIVEELRAAGVQPSGQPLQTLSYKELTRLLALWHMAHGRNYYEANEERAPAAPRAANTQR